MDYDSIPSHIKEFIDREIYNSSPPELAEIFIRNAEKQYMKRERNILEMAHYVSGSSRCINYIHEEMTPHMNFVQHIYTLNGPEPTRGEFIDYVLLEYRRLSSTLRFIVNNITFRYDTSEGYVQWLSFSRHNIDTMGFENALYHMISGHTQWDENFYGGSDYVRNYFHKRSLSYVSFDIITELIQGGYGEVQYDYYSCLKLTNNDDNDCLLECFRYFGNIDMTNEQIRQLLDVSMNTMLSLEHVSILENLFGIEVTIYADRKSLRFKYKSGKHYYDHRAIIVKDFPVTFYGSLNTPNKILWKDNHFSVIVDEYMARQCHCEHTGVFVGYHMQLTREQIIEELYRQGRIDTDETTVDEEDNLETFFYFFDYETIYKPRTLELMPYAWALIKCDKNGNVLRIWNDVIDNYEADLSSICTILTRECPRSNERKYLIGYNNSRFDNFFLINECQRNNVYVNNVFFSNNAILGLNIRGFIVRDLCRILCTTLRDACDGYKTNLSKGVLEHQDIQRSFMMNENIDKEQVREYVLRDCTSLAELFFKSRLTFHNLIGVSIENYNTIASMCYRSFRNACELEHAKYPILDKYTNDIVRQSIYGGRSQIFKQCEESKHSLISIDCVSLYPYVMLNRRYPIGQPISTAIYREGKLGMYRCIIKKQPQRNIIPYREENKPLQWNCNNKEIKCMLNSVDIECLRRHGGVVQILAGYYWDEDSDNIFKDFFNKIIEEKYRQDEYKTAADTNYNPAVRESCKLLMNSLSGKLQQRVFEWVIELVRNNEDLHAFRKKTKNNTETFTPIGQWYIARGKKINIRPKTPTIWGSLILSYARSYMYDNILNKIPIIYGMDTDSAFIRQTDIPHELIGDNLGEFKKELIDKMQPNDKGPYGIFVSPKCYCFYKITSEGLEVPIKMRFKGVNIKQDKVVTSDIEKEKDIKIIHDLYWSDDNKIDINVFRKLLVEDVYILCSTLDKKISDNILHKLAIKQRFGIKKINRDSIDNVIFN